MLLWLVIPHRPRHDRCTTIISIFICICCRAVEQPSLVIDVCFGVEFRSLLHFSERGQDSDISMIYLFHTSCSSSNTLLLLCASPIVASKRLRCVSRSRDYDRPFVVIALHHPLHAKFRMCSVDCGGGGKVLLLFSFLSVRQNFGIGSQFVTIWDRCPFSVSLLGVSR